MEAWLLELALALPLPLELALELSPPPAPPALRPPREHVKEALTLEALLGLTLAFTVPVRLLLWLEDMVTVAVREGEGSPL